MNESPYSASNSGSNVTGSDRLPVIAMIRGLLGAMAGAAAGFFVFRWMVSHGFYAMILPGALMGLGCGYASGRRSIVLGGLCGVLAVPLGLFCEAMVRPFLVDNSFSFFFSHLGELDMVTWLMIAGGTFMSYWFGIGRHRM